MYIWYNNHVHNLKFVSFGHVYKSSVLTMIWLDFTFDSIFGLHDRLKDAFVFARGKSHARSNDLHADESFTMSLM